jgi:hypothetical protein
VQNRTLLTICVQRKGMISINRQVAIIKPREPYVAWINSLSGNEEPSSIESLSNDCTALLIPHFNDDDESSNFIKRNFKQIFEMELNSWNENKKTWPKKRDYALFCEWVKIEFHSEVFDFGEGSIEIDQY